jgi:putative endonuclease
MNKGEFGETLAKNFLIKKGYKIIFQNFRTKYSEIDIIAEKNNRLIFVEVKYRTNRKFGKAEESITDKKIKKIEDAASVFLNRFYKGHCKVYQFDILAINNFDKLEINHYENITGG